jgi:hypothetical protein
MPLLQITYECNIQLICCSKGVHTRTHCCCCSRLLTGRTKPFTDLNSLYSSLSDA